MRHILSVLVENHPGVLVRVASLLSRRNLNIETLVVKPSEDPPYSQITLVTDGDSNVVTHVAKQIDRVVGVVRVLDMSQIGTMRCEVALAE